MKFRDLGLSEELLKAVDDAGYTAPTPIQEKAIPIVLQGRDMFGVAQTGTGKTASFTLPMIEILAAGKPKARMPRSLILEPTRELAAQVADNFEIYGKYHKLSLALLIGGVRMDEQNKKVDRGVDVLIATPGRLLDHVENGRLMLGGIKFIVIDEGDRLLDMGFMPDVEKIVSLTPPLRQTLFFSATMPNEIKRLAKKFLNNPKEVLVAPPASPAETVKQSLVVVPAKAKRDVLANLLRSENAHHALIFCNRKRDVGVLARSLKKDGFDASELHGDMQQSLRMETLAKFKTGDIEILVASDVAARGLDIQGLPHVFNFDVPTHPEDYIHRIGRTGRAGLSGRAITLAAPEDGKYVTAIAKLIGTPIPPMDPPGAKSESLEDAPKGRGRGGQNRRQGSSRGGQQSTTAERAKPDAEPRKTESSKPAPDAKASRPAQRPESSPSQKAEPQKSERPEPRKSSRRNPERIGASQNSSDTVGMGDHVPAFMQRLTAPKSKRGSGRVRQDRRRTTRAKTAE